MSILFVTCERQTEEIFCTKVVSRTEKTRAKRKRKAKRKSAANANELF